MRRLSLAIPALLLVCPYAHAAQTQFEKDVEIGAPVSSGNLTLFPLKPKGSIDDADYMTLDEAFKAKVLTVKEMGEGGSVNSLIVTNTGTKPIYVMAGELLLGGKQDRIMGQTTVIPSKAARMPVAVYCVEHGRWSGASASFETSGDLGHTTLRKKALFEGQGEVWAEVSRSNDKLATKTETDTYRKAAKKLEADTATRKAEILAALDKTAKVTGLAVGISGRIVAVEYFRSPILFSKLREKLVGSYVAESLARSDSSQKGSVTSKDIIAFMTTAESAPKVREKKDANAKAYDFSSNFIDGELVVPEKAPAPAQHSYFLKAN